MDLLVAVNSICSIVITLAASAFVFFVFTGKALTEKLPKWQSILVKVGLCTILGGALLSFFTTSASLLAQVILNLGMSVMLSWSAVSYYKYFVKDSK